MVQPMTASTCHRCQDATDTVALIDHRSSAAALRKQMREAAQRILAEHKAQVPLPAPLRGDHTSTARALRVMAAVAVDAFFDNDLLTAARKLLRGAMGSFGLVLSHSLDCDREVVVAARGQTMSVAFYPRTGIVCWGSESSATKAAMGLDIKGQCECPPSPSVQRPYLVSLRHPTDQTVRIRRPRIDSVGTVALPRASPREKKLTGVPDTSGGPSEALRPR